uniref:Zinc finger protein 11-like n=1 Tax=Labrus bergylta TaxID=56723 RepID=A0A3Q3F2J6_9LABR
MWRLWLLGKTLNPKLLLLLQRRCMNEIKLNLLLPSLRLFIPPLRLVSAAMWQVVQRGNVQDYGMVEEFISTVSDIVPELLNADQRAQLLLGLRARVRGRTSLLMIIKRYLRDTQFEFPESNFVDQVELLLKDAEEREKFFQDVFPTDFGPDYDSALQVLMLDFLSRLEKLLPVPDIQQTASMLSAVPSALEECVHSVPDPRHLKTVLLHHTTLGHFDLSGESRLELSRFKHMHGLKRHQIYAICHRKIARFTWKKELRAGPSQTEAPSDAQQTAALKVPVWCSNCGKHFEYLSALKEHQENVCKVDLREIMKCNDCDKEFKSMTMLKVHQRIHDPLYCKECGKILANEPAFERHKLMHRPMQCTMCDKTFTLLRRLREHYEKQHSFTGPYPCPQCEKSFITLSYLFPFSCSLCPEKFRSSNCLTVHLRKHTGEKPFLCWQCGKSYRSASELTVHMGTHSEEKPWACTQCDMAYRTKLQLTNHVEQIHIGVRYPCNSCGKQFMKETSLKRHELIHSGERPHQCTVCGKTFLTANELRLHNRYHTGERPYKCEECGKAFIQSGYLKSHMRIHTGEKPFKCDVCDKSFRLSYHMKKHQRTHSGKPKSYMCEECGLAFLHKKSLWEHSLTHDVKIEQTFAEEVRIEFQ